MPRIELDRARIERFLESAADQLTGDWLDNAAAAVWFASTRRTEDIDLIGDRGIGNADLLRVMEIAESHGLPVETVNAAAGFYLVALLAWCAASGEAVDRGRVSADWHSNNRPPIPTLPNVADSPPTDSPGE